MRPDKDELVRLLPGIFATRKAPVSVGFKKHRVSKQCTAARRLTAMPTSATVPNERPARQANTPTCKRSTSGAEADAHNNKELTGYQELHENIATNILANLHYVVVSANMLAALT